MPANTPTLGLPYPIPDDTVDVPRDIKALADSLDPLGMVPVGAFMMWLTAIAPVNWLLMNGQLADAALYPKLATLLGQAGGNVTIPDMRDVFPAGAGPTMALGSRGGASAVALNEAQLAPHYHRTTGKTGATDRPLAHSHIVTAMLGNIVGYPAGGGAAQSGMGQTATTADAAPDHLHSFDLNSDSRGGGQAHENRPPFLAINFIIRAG